MKNWIIFLMILFSLNAISEEKYKTGLIIPKDWKSKAKFESSIIRDVGVPAEFDWRKEVTLSPILNQGNCGSCWDFSATATFKDDMIVQKPVSAPDSSTQQVLDCNRQGYGCDGGFFDVDEYFVSPGTSKDSAYGSYVAKKQSCKSGIPVYGKAAGWAYVAQSSNGSPSDAEIKAAIMAYGPVSVGVAADNAFSAYTGGVFTNCVSKQLNHAVQLVGWSDSGGYWIMRNSWGSNWGESGYMRLKFGCNGIGEAANYFKFDGSPTPTPDPTPGPTPDPTPVPPCTLPKVSTGFPAQVNAKKGKIYNLGSRAVSGETYIWTAEPAFNGGVTPTTAQIRYQPAITKVLTITAKNDCGSASATSAFNLSNVSKVEVFD